MFYNRWVLLWAQWLPYNGPHCGMHPSTLPAPCIYALTYSCGDTLCNGDSYIKGNALWQHWHDTMSICCYWKKQRAERGQGCCVAPHQSAQTAQRRDCLNLAPFLILSYIQMVDEKFGDGSLLGQAFGRLLRQFWKAQSFHMTSHKPPL